MQKLLRGRKGRIVRRRRQIARPARRQQIVEDRDRVDHDYVAIDDRGDETRRIDRQKFAILLDPREQIDRAHAIGQPHFLEQPHDPETASFAIDGNHRVHSSEMADLPRTLWRLAPASPTCKIMVRPNAPDRFNEEKATYVVRGSGEAGDKPDLTRGADVLRGVVKKLPVRPGVYRMLDARRRALRGQGT